MDSPNQSGYDERETMNKQTLLPALSLFTSAGTLICCALPALFVTLGAGATLAGLVSTAPWLITFSKYKVWTFCAAGVLLIAATLMQWRARNAPCPVDPAQAKACTHLRKISRWILGLSIAIYATGFFFAFMAVHLL
ncbi:MAG: hypothetical protein P8P30_04580 [Rickettsiales bacterium]|nr:hypothetical protein [Rickettsiales bacterium]